MITKEEAVIRAIEILATKHLDADMDLTKPTVRYVDSKVKDFWAVEFPYREGETKKRVEIFGDEGLWVKVDTETGSANVGGPYGK